MEIKDTATNAANEALYVDASTTSQFAESRGNNPEPLQNAEHQLRGNCRTYVRDSPITSLELAMATGFLPPGVLRGR